MQKVSHAKKILDNAVLLLLKLYPDKSIEISGSSGLADQKTRRLLEYLQQEYYIDIVTSLKGARVTESVILTERGKRFLLRTLQSMFELPE